jgi:hypothetical protein
MRFVRGVFLVAGLTGIVILLPMYHEARFFSENPPVINRPEFYYGFVGVTLAWQLLFLVIAFDPVRYRLAILPALVEKGSFALAIPLLYAYERVSSFWLYAAAMDGTWLILFALAYCWTPTAWNASTNGKNV